MKKEEEKVFDGTVLQLSFDGKKWTHQLNILTGSLFPQENLILNQRNSMLNFLDLLLNSKDGIFYVLGFGAFFGYMVYKYFYILKRKKKDIVDMALQGRFNF
jgi:hypothetical protein